jgi:acyl-CoA synthetase (AMP-forming)/AMP-acid ligase II
VHAVVVLRDAASSSPEELLDWCRDRIAGYRRPRSLSIIREEEMPRTTTGKILHRELKARHGASAS